MIARLKIVSSIFLIFEEDILGKAAMESYQHLV